MNGFPSTMSLHDEPVRDYIELGDEWGVEFHSYEDESGAHGVIQNLRNPNAYRISNKGDEISVDPSTANKWHPHLLHIQKPYTDNTFGRIHCDVYEDLIWTTSNEGRATSYSLPSFIHHSSFILEPHFPPYIQYITSTFYGILAVSPISITSHSRGGMCNPLLSSKKEKSLLTEAGGYRDAQLSGEEQLLFLAADMPKLFVLDIPSCTVNTCYQLPHGISKVTQSLPSIAPLCTSQTNAYEINESTKPYEETLTMQNSEYTHPTKPTAYKAINKGDSSLVYIGGDNGRVSLLDVRTARVIRTFNAHKQLVTSISASDFYIATCGAYKNGESNFFVADSFVKVFDIRYLRPTSPLWMSTGASTAKFYPHSHDQLMIACTDGCCTTMNVKTFESHTFPLYNLQAPIADFDISSNGEMTVFLDASGSIFQFQRTPSTSIPRLNTFSRPTAIAAPLQFDIPCRPLDDAEALCSNGIPSTIGELQPLLSERWTISDNELEFLNKHLIDEKRSNVVGEQSGVSDKRWVIDMHKREANTKKPRFTGIKVTRSRYYGERFYSIKFDTPSRPPLPIPKCLIKDVKKASNMLYVENKFAWRPNSLLYGIFKPSVHPTVDESDRFNEKEQLNDEVKSTHTQSNRIGTASVDGADKPPESYRYTTLFNRSRSGKDRVYNTTDFIGMENGTKFDYVHCILQILYFIETVKEALKNHMCSEDNCLSCDLGFIFHTIDLMRADVNESPTVLSTNFKTSFSQFPEANVLGLLRPSDERNSLLRKTEAFYRFLIATMMKEIEQHSDIGLSSILSTSLSSTICCTKVGHNSAVHSRTVLIDLDVMHLTPSKVELSTTSSISHNTSLESARSSPVSDRGCEVSSPASERPSSVDGTAVQESEGTMKEENAVWVGGKRRVYIDFVTLIQNTLQKNVVQKIYCEGCGQNVECRNSRKICSLPKVLALNCNILSEKELRIWRNSMPNGFLKASIFVDLHEDVRVYASPYEGSVKYELSMIAFLIKDGQSKDSKDEHMASYVKVPTSYELNKVSSEGIERKDTMSRDSNGHQNENDDNEVKEEMWLLMNDIVVKKASFDEVSDFTPKWKIPSLLFYVKKEPLAAPSDVMVESAVPKQRNNLISLSMFLNDTNMATNVTAQRREPSFMRLDAAEIEELNTKGLLVALDAEFVALRSEAAEIREDGKKEILQPSHLSLARLSVIRGDGKNEGIPFIDHYIYSKNPPNDYLTRFSGVQSGDLDPSLTVHWLTTKKAIYQKLRYLIDAGCIFIGHGLKTDFRKINIYAPSHQIIDTVELYRLPGQRLISLKFLAAHILKKSIQKQTHDSVEDAKTALALYQEYLKLKEANELQATISNLYSIGYKTKWKTE